MRAICMQCVMDDSAPGLDLDEAGVCAYCRAAAPLLEQVRLTPAESEERLEQITTAVKRGHTRNGHDSVVGLSGGVDSSYTALLAASRGLRPIAVHLDNGWNSEIAVSNIQGVVDACGLDLVTLVIDWREFRDLQRAFLKAGVVDIEMLSDHAIVATMFRLCKQRGVKHVISGTNVATEHGMPRAWVWHKQDLTNIVAIHGRFGSVPLRTFPRMGLAASIWRRHLATGVRFVELLDAANFRRSNAIAELQQRAGWRDYGGKHYESVFTRFYQAYILPTKFGIDKRRVHLSALIRNGELSREEALLRLAEPLYPADELARDKEFVVKKLGFSQSEFDALMRSPPVPHDAYRSDRRVRDAIKALAGRIRVVSR